MRKGIVLLLCFFLLSGCDVQYNLEIDGNNIKEVTSASSTSDTDPRYEVYGEQFISIWEDYKNICLPLTNLNDTDFMNCAESFVPDQYYVIERINNVDYGLIASGKFNTNYPDSSIVNFGTDNSNIRIEDHILKIDVDTFSIFEYSPILDSITVNIKVLNGKVLSNNADEINDNVYTWNLSREDYDEKNISLYVKEGYSLSSVSEGLTSTGKNMFDSIKQFPNIGMIIICIFIVLIAIVLYHFIKKKENNVNNF